MPGELFSIYIVKRYFNTQKKSVTISKVGEKFVPEPGQYSGIKGKSISPNHSQPQYRYTDITFISDVGMGYRSKYGIRHLNNKFLTDGATTEKLRNS